MGEILEIREVIQNEKRSILFSLLVLLVSVALCGCGGDKKTETSSESNTSSEGTPTSGGSVVFGMTQTW